MPLADEHTVTNSPSGFICIRYVPKFREQFVIGFISNIFQKIKEKARFCFLRSCDNVRIEIESKKRPLLRLDEP